MKAVKGTLRIETNDGGIAVPMCCHRVLEEDFARGRMICPVCGTRYAIKTVQKILRAGQHELTLLDRCLIEAVALWEAAKRNPELATV